RARLFATALGLYEPYVNGQRVSDEVFRPGWTDYNKRVQHDAYDITHLLTTGENVIGAIPPDQCYSGHAQAMDGQFYGERPRLLAQVLIEFHDGSTQIIPTDRTWKTALGPILGSDIMAGESYDARLEIPGWNQPSFNDTEWSPVKQFPDP